MELSAREKLEDKELQSAPKVIDLFCGAGGLSLGLQSAGFDIVAAVDNDAAAAKTYRHNLGNHLIESSIYNISPTALLSRTRLAPGNCDLLVGGPPCQGFSVQRRGEDYDLRNHLVLEYLSFIEEVLPRFFMMENVRGLISKRGKPYFNKFIQRTQGIGYTVHVAKLNTAGYGVPQERIRVFMVGERRPKECASFTFPKPILQPEQYRTVRSAIGDIPSPPEDGSPYPEYPLHFREARLSALNLERFKHIPEGGGRDDLPPHLQLPCHVNNPSHRHKDVYGRMAWDKPSPTLTARFDSFSRGRFGHPTENRTITLREGARLMTFPDDFHFFGSREEVARQIGNAVPPLVAKILGIEIMNCLIHKPQNIYNAVPAQTEEQLSLFGVTE
jgi:DNA (cytosine-5)-methyltransferase 1